MEFHVFLFVPTASPPVTGHHWEEPGSVFFSPSHQVSIYTEKIPLEHSLFSDFSPIWQMLQVLNHRSSLSCSREPRTGHRSPDVPHQGRAGDKDHLPWPTGNTLFNAAQESCWPFFAAHRQHVAHPTFWISNRYSEMQTASSPVPPATDIFLTMKDIVCISNKMKCCVSKSRFCCTWSWTALSSPS